MFTNSSAEANEELNENEEILSAVNLDELQVSGQEVELHLKNLDPTKACAPGGIPASILIECSRTIAPFFVNCLMHLYVLENGLLSGKQQM